MATACSVIDRPIIGTVTWLAESLDEQAVPKAAVADRERFPPELRDHRPHDAGAGEDHLGALGLQADDLAALSAVRVR